MVRRKAIERTRVDRRGDDDKSEEESEDEDEKKKDDAKSTKAPAMSASPSSTPPAAPTLEPSTASNGVAASVDSIASVNSDAAQSQGVDRNAAAPSQGVDRNANRSSPTGVTIAFAVIGSLAAVSLLIFFIWKLYRRRRRNLNVPPTEAVGPSVGPKSDIRIMNEAMVAVYAAESGKQDPSRHSDSLASENWKGYQNDSHGPSTSTPGWLTRQVTKFTRPTTPPPPPDAPDTLKNAGISKWMDRHSTRMLDPMSARASVVSSAATDLGPPPSVSPASVVGGNRESVLSEMGQIRRAAVPPPLDLGMVERVRRMQLGEAEATHSIPGDSRLPPTVGHQSSSDPPPPSQIGTEATWNTWGVEQHPRR